MSETTAAPKEYSDAEFKKIINTFNAYRDYRTTTDEKGNEKPTEETGVVESNDGANIEERIVQLYSDTYRKYNTVILGYQTYNDIEELMEVPTEELTDSQKINSQFVVKTNKGATIAFFDTLRFHNRPIYCGVNVLYDPTVSDKFVAIANNPTDEYFNNPWNAEYENPDYNSKDGRKTCRDLCFNKSYLEDLQSKASEESELVMAFIRKGFDVGIGEVSANNLTSGESIIPPMYGRVFENIWRDKIVAYSPVIMQSIVSREIPVVSKDGEIVPQLDDVSNNNCYFTCPSVEVNGVKQEASVESTTITKPSIIYVGENIAGYSLFSYINVPVCSWEYFKSKSSGFGSDDPAKPTKVVQRLEDTQCCGPFMRIKAKGYYTSETNEVLRGYTTIKIAHDKNEGIKKYEFSKVTVDNKEVWAGPEGDLSDHLKKAAEIVYEDYAKENKNPRIRFLKYNTEANENRDALYENAYVRGDPKNPAEIQNIFNEVILPDRFAFYILTNTNTICVAQFPCIPLSGAEPLEDDYITQWVPLYKKIETDPSSTEITWYINKFDILVKRGNNDAKFYNINRQKSSLVTYPEKGNDFNDIGYVYTCNGVVYKGPSYKAIDEEKYPLNDKRTKIKDEPNVPLYINVDGKYVELIDGGEYSKYEDATRLRKAKYIPDNIQGISLSEPNNNSIYISGPINIAQYNKLEFMDLPSTSNIARASRDGYKEFIKNGCVFSDSGSNDPKVYIPDTVNFTFAGNTPETIEPKVEAQAIEEIQPEPEWKNTVKWVIIGVIVVVILGLLVIIGFKIKNAFKGNVDNFTCPGYAARWSR